MCRQTQPQTKQKCSPPTWKPLHNLPLPPAMNLTSSPAPSLANISHYILLSWHILAVKFSPASRLFALADVFATIPTPILRKHSVFFLGFCSIVSWPGRPSWKFQQRAPLSHAWCVPVPPSSFKFFPIQFISIWYFQWICSLLPSLSTRIQVRKVQKLFLLSRIMIIEYVLKQRSCSIKID